MGSMPKSKIEWTDFTLNPVKGKCPVACDYCYARKMYDRFKWNPKVRFQPSVFNTLPKKPCKIFVGSTMELFLFDDWMEFILNRCEDFPHHIFQFLTKQPQNLIKFSPFPDNCWVGVSATNQEQYKSALVGLAKIEAKVKYISFEPLLEYIATNPPYDLEGINWVIIGGCSGRQKFYPPEYWIQVIKSACDKAGIPIFEKNNLYPAGFRHLLRQEMPK